MRKNKAVPQQKDFSILALDDDSVMTLTLQSYFEASGYHVDTENDPVSAIERVRSGHYDILLLDFLMTPILGDEVVSRIRAFNKDLYIILLTGHKSMAPPLKTIRELDIQGYYEKSDRFDQLELLIESCAKSITQMRTIRSYRDGLNRILEDLPALYRCDSVQEALQTILQSVLALLPGSDGFAFIDTLHLSARSSLPELPGGSRFFCGAGRYQNALPEGERVYAGFRGGGASARRSGDLLLAALTDDKHEVFGVIGLQADRSSHSDLEQLLEVFARQAGSALCNVLFRTVIKVKNRQLNDAYSAMHENYLEMIDAMRLMVDAKDIYTRGHSDRVSFYAKRIAEKMGRSADYVERVRIAGLFHDIGKLGTDDDILRKPTALTDSEYAEVKTHCVRGERILSSLRAFSEICPIVRSHHERWDGQGYPDGLHGCAIPEEARIINVADSFDAMTSHRIYQKELSLDQAIEQLQKGRGSQFDPAITDVFIEVLRDYPAIQQELAWTFGDNPDQIEANEVQL